MDPLKTFQYFVAGTTLVIGLFMVFQYYDSALPPALSGAVFILIGISRILELQNKS